MTISKAQIEAWVAENSANNWGAPMNSDDQAEVLALALEALELRALVPTDEELKATSALVNGMDQRQAWSHQELADAWLDRVRAWKGQSR